MGAAEAMSGGEREGTVRGQAEMREPGGPESTTVALDFWF